jgi:hypothetical protein
LHLARLGLYTTPLALLPRPDWSYICQPRVFLEFRCLPFPNDLVSACTPCPFVSRTAASTRARVYFASNVTLLLGPLSRAQRHGSAAECHPLLNSRSPHAVSRPHVALSRQLRTANASPRRRKPCVKDLKKENCAACSQLVAPHRTSPSDAETTALKGSWPKKPGLLQLSSLGQTVLGTRASNTALDSIAWVTSRKNELVEGSQVQVQHRLNSPPRLNGCHSAPLQLNCGHEVALKLNDPHTHRLLTEN